MVRGASYRPQYGNDMVPPPTRGSSSQNNGNQNQNTMQGDYASSKASRFDAYAMVDAWRSYREDHTTLSGSGRNQPLNPTASGFTPAEVGALDVHPPLQSTSHFRPYQPLRFSNGQSEAQLVQSLKTSGSASLYTQNHHSFPIRSTGPVTPLQNQIGDGVLPTVEPRVDHIVKQQAGIHEFRRGNARQSTPRRTPQRTVSPPPIPEPSEVYLAQARLPPVRRATPKKCLVILDLNGTCIARPNLFEPKVFKVRPGIHTLFDYLFELHVVMIFTSMHHKNAAAILDKLFTPSQRSKLAGLWARDKLGLTTGQLHVKTQTYKNLIPIWEDKAIQSTYPAHENRRGWDQSNTVMIDDSHLKAVSHPHNLLLIPEYSKKDASKEKLLPAIEKSEAAILQSVILKLEELKHQADVSRLILRWQTGRAPIPREPRPDSAREQETRLTAGEPVQLLTPADTPSEDSQDDEVHQKLSAQMNVLAAEDRRERAVSEIPEGVWAELLNGSVGKT